MITRGAALGSFDVDHIAGVPQPADVVADGIGGLTESLGEVRRPQWSVGVPHLGENRQAQRVRNSPHDSGIDAFAGHVPTLDSTKIPRNTQCARFVAHKVLRSDRS